MAELTLRKVVKQYSPTTPRAVDDLNLEMRDGEFIALLGPSGCGKSTTLRMVAGLETITEGEMLIGGKVINNTHPKDRGIGLAFENYALYPPLKVRENLAFNLKAHGVSATRDRKTGGRNRQIHADRRSARFETGSAEQRTKAAGQHRESLDPATGSPFAR